MQFWVIVLALILALSVTAQREEARVKNTVGVKVEMDSRRGVSTRLELGTEVREGQSTIEIRAGSIIRQQGFHLTRSGLPCIIVDPIHGDIELTREEQRVLDSREMQRLRSIKQLGTATASIRRTLYPF